jgi:hypothetical protein
LGRFGGTEEERRPMARVDHSERGVAVREHGLKLLVYYRREIPKTARNFRRRLEVADPSLLEDSPAVAGGGQVETPGQVDSARGG